MEVNDKTKATFSTPSDCPTTSIVSMRKLYLDSEGSRIVHISSANHGVLKNPN